MPERATIVGVAMDDDGNFACPACERTFATYHALYGHTLRLHDFAIARSEASYADAQPVAHNADSVFACPVECCGFQHTKLYRVQDHTEQAHDMVVVRAAPLDATDGDTLDVPRTSVVVPIQRGRNGTLECPQHSCTFETDVLSSLAVHAEARHEIGVAIGPPGAPDGERVREARVQHMLSAHDAHHSLPATVSDDAMTSRNASLQPTPEASPTATTSTLLPNEPSPETDGAMMLATTAAVVPIDQMSDPLSAPSTDRSSLEPAPTPATTLLPDEPSSETGRVTVPTASSPRLAVSPIRTTQRSVMAFKLPSSVVLSPVAATTEATPILAHLTPLSSRPHDAFTASPEERFSAAPQPVRSNAVPSPLRRHEHVEASDGTPTSSTATSCHAPEHDVPPIEAASEPGVLTASVASPPAPPVAQGASPSEPFVEHSPSHGADLNDAANLDGKDGDDGEVGDDGEDNLDDENGDDSLNYDDEPRLVGSEAASSSVDASSEPAVLRVTSPVPKEVAVPRQPVDEPFMDLSPPSSPGGTPIYDDDGVDYQEDGPEDDNDDDKPPVSGVPNSPTDAPSEAVTASDVPTSPLARAVEASDEPFMAPLSPEANLGHCPDSPRTPVLASVPFASLVYRPETPETPSLPPTPDVAPTPSPFHNMRHSVRPTPPRRSNYHSDDDDNGQTFSPVRGRAPARRSLAGLSSSESSASPPRQRPLEPFECPETLCSYEHVNFSVFKFHCLREHGLHIRQESDDEDEEDANVELVQQPPPPPPQPQSARRPTKAPVKPKTTKPVQPRTAPPPAPTKTKPSPPSSPDVVVVRPVVTLYKNSAGEYACPTPTCPYKKTSSISKLQTHCKAKHAYDVKKADDVPPLPKRQRKRPFVNATLVDGDDPATKYLRTLEALEPGQEVYVCVT